MFLLLFLTGLVSSTGWHASVYRLNNNGCNDYKTRMEQSNFCDLLLSDCNSHRGSEIVGDDALFAGETEVQPSLIAQGNWIDVVNSWGLDISAPLTSQCDVLRLAAIVGKPWNKLFDDRDAAQLSWENNVVEISVGSPLHRIRLIKGESEETSGISSQKSVTVTGEINVELFILVEGTEVNFNVESIRLDGESMGDLFLPQEFGFLTSSRYPYVKPFGISSNIKEAVHEPFFFGENLKQGFLQSPTARCISDPNGSELLVREMLYANEQGAFVASCLAGHRVPKFTMRKATSRQSAIGVCVSNDNPAGDDTIEIVSDALIDHSTAVKMCNQMDSKKIPTLTQVRNSDFCERIFPFGNFFYIWVRNDVNEQPTDVETVENMIQHSGFFDSEISDQDSLIVNVQSYTVRREIEIERLPGSDQFPQLMQSSDRWGLVAEYTFPKNCQVLETTVSYNPVTSDPITSVSRMIVSRSNGIWAHASYVDISGPRAQLRDPALNGDSIISSLWTSDGSERPELQGSTFFPYSDMNFFSGNTFIQPFGPPSGLDVAGDSRQNTILYILRSWLAVDTVSECSFGSVSNAIYQVSRLMHADTDYNLGQNADDSLDRTEWDQRASLASQRKITLIPGRFYYIWSMFIDLNRNWQSNLDFTGISYLWDCGRGAEVIPRKHLFNMGNSNDEIISNVSHLDITEKTHFKVMLTKPLPTEGVSVVCSGPSNLVITPSQLTFDSDWVYKTVDVYASPTASFGREANPDVFIQCTSPGLHPLSISVTIQPTIMPLPQHFLVSPSGHYANWYHDGSAWNVRDASLAPEQETSCVYNLLNYHGSFSFYIQTRHDSVSASGITIGPMVGVAFAYGPHVYAAYSSVISDSWNVYRLSTPTPGGPKVSIESLADPVNPGRVTIDFPCGSSCEIIPHAEHFMQLSCSISGSFTNTPWSEPVCVSSGQSFFHYPDGGTNNLIVQTSVPTWPVGSENNVIFDSPVAPAILDGKSMTFPAGEKMTADEVSEFTNWQETLNNGGDLGWWSNIQSKCPLMSDKVVSALRPFSRSQTSQWVPELSSTQFIRSMLSRCHTDNLMQKFLGCLGPYQFNEDDATQSFRSVIFDFVTFSRGVSNNFGMIGRSLTMLADNGVPGQLCSRLGHLVGTPPTCVCKVNGGSAYPNCPDTIDCPPATAQQLSMMSSLANSVVGTDFCTAEKSIVIVRSLGVSVNCFRGFCYYWSNPRTRTGLKYEMCVTPYCVTGYHMNSVGSITWYGLTECGETVISSNNGETWTVSSTSLPDDTAAEQLATPVGDQKVRVSLLSDGEYYEVDSSGIARAGISSGKMVTVTMKWWCECIDPDVWNLIV